MNRKTVLERIRVVLGCDPVTAAKVGDVLDRWTEQDPGVGASRSVIWTCFAQYRKTVLDAGRDDPIWDVRVSLAASAPDLVEGGVS